MNLTRLNTTEKDRLQRVKEQCFSTERDGYRLPSRETRLASHKLAAPVRQYGVKMKLQIADLILSAATTALLYAVAMLGAVIF